MSRDQDAQKISFLLTPDNPRFLANICGLANDHLDLLQQRLDIKISNRGNAFTLHGEGERIAAGKYMLERLYESADEEIDPEMIHLLLRDSNLDDLIIDPVKKELPKVFDEDNLQDDKLYAIQTPKAIIRPRGLQQKLYVHSVSQNDINFGIGPAGTGKTYLAVACAVQALLNDDVRRILLVRPAVEAGEKLGFLPGDLSQKVDPYLRPLYDALYEMLGFERVDKLIEKKVIEIAPLAYMRGRTLSHSFIILDESQNTTREQMKMFLTRIGFGSTAIITGDPSQIDLPRGSSSGLGHAIDVLSDVRGISLTHFSSKDVVRHPLVQRIVDAYDAFSEKNGDK